MLRALVFRLGLVPQTRLVPGPSAQIPRLDDAVTRCVDIAFGVDLLDADLEAVLGEGDVLFRELVGCGLRDFLDGEVDVVPNETEDGEDEEEN